MAQTTLTITPVSVDLISVDLMPGVFADASRRTDVIERLQAHQIPVTVPANPLVEGSES